MSGVIPQKRFRELKNFGVKTASFDQIKCLVKYADHIEKSDCKVVGEGVCAALSMAWLQEKFARKSDRFVSKTNRALWDIASLEATTDSIPKYIKYRRDFTDGSDYIEATGRLAEEYDLSLGEAFPIKLFSGQEVEVHKNLPNDGGMYAHALVFPKSDPSQRKAHCVAFFKGADGKFHFFDPNIGAYEIEGNSEKFYAFFGKYQELVEEHLWTYGNTTLWPVTPR